MEGSVHHRRDTIHCFRAELDTPELTLDLGELQAASWFDRSDLPPNLAPYVLPVLTRAPPPATAASRPRRGSGLGGCRPARGYSHSIVPGGLLVMSSTTRPTGRISLIIREAICSSRS